MNITATYDYRDAAGHLVYQVCRLEPKSFRGRQPLEGSDTEWQWNLDGVERLLYRLPYIVTSEAQTTIYVCEGEKDADNLVRLGFLATSNSGGASKWPASCNEYLRGRHVVILPDNDDPGRKHAEDVALLLELSEEECGSPSRHFNCEADTGEILMTWAR